MAADIKRSSLNHFTARAVDRVTDKRRDEAWLAARLEDENTRFVLVFQSMNLFAEGEVARPVLLPPDEVQDLIDQAELIALLGLGEGRVYFAIDVPAEGDSPPASLAA
jgi:NAD+ diphosphatase